MISKGRFHRIAWILPPLFMMGLVVPSTATTGSGEPDIAVMAARKYRRRARRNNTNNVPGLADQY